MRSISSSALRPVVACSSIAASRAVSSELEVGELYRRYGPIIFSHCRRLLKDAIAAEDATQEVFLRVVRHVSSLPDDSSVLSWIYRISTNYCLNHLRDNRQEAQSMAVLPEREGGDLEGELLYRDLARRVMDAPPELRLPVELYYLRGLCQDRIAELLGLSRRTILYRLAAFTRRARQLAELETDRP